MSETPARSSAPRLWWVAQRTHPGEIPGNEPRGDRKAQRRRSDINCGLQKGKSKCGKCIVVAEFRIRNLNQSMIHRSMNQSWTNSEFTLNPIDNKTIYYWRCGPIFSDIYTAFLSRILSLGKYGPSPFIGALLFPLPLGHSIQKYGFSSSKYGFHPIFFQIIWMKLKIWLGRSRANTVIMIKTHSMLRSFKLIPFFYTRCEGFASRSFSAVNWVNNHGWRCGEVMAG